MSLIERETYLSYLTSIFSSVEEGEGHSVFISGESGIGKTSLLKLFTNTIDKKYSVYEGICDAFFTPRPLAPLYDIAYQLSAGLLHDATDMHDRAGLFSKFLHEIKSNRKPCVIIFEDIHWADDATLDFIRFMTRRITQVPCMFILTYRDTEITTNHPLMNVLGQLSPRSSTRISLKPLSKNAVMKLSDEKGFDGEKVFALSGGNPYYVSEILASYSDGVPETIRDGIIAAYNKTGEKTRHVWDLLSVIPGRFELKHLEQFDPSYASAIENCMQLQILIQDKGYIFFKHELFRRSIESIQSPLKRITLHKTILDLFLESFERNGQVEKIVHHAKNANEYDLVLKYAPLAAKQAGRVGAHLQASKLLLTAIEYYQEQDVSTLLPLYKSYAYECYVTSNIEEAIIYSNKVLHYVSNQRDVQQTAATMRFLAQLWWIAGNKEKSLDFAEQAVDIIKSSGVSGTKAMVFSNMAQLKMLCNEHVESVIWSEKAIREAELTGDIESKCHALNSLGSVQMNLPGKIEEGIRLLDESRKLALEHEYDEHAARAFINLAAGAINLKDYNMCGNVIDEGLKYFEERELDLWEYHLLAIKARLKMELGIYSEALEIAGKVLSTTVVMGCCQVQALAIVSAIATRKGEVVDTARLLDAKDTAFENEDWQLIVPVALALLEYEWLTGNELLSEPEVLYITRMLHDPLYYADKNQLLFWLKRTRNLDDVLKFTYEGYDSGSGAALKQSADYWHKKSNAYMRALLLFEGNESDKKQAVNIMDELGLTAVCEKMKQQLRSAGIKGIPRGLRKSTRSNSALLTGREMEILQLLKIGLQNKEIANKLFISAKTVDHHISSILFKFDVNSRVKAVSEAVRMSIIK